MIPCLFTMFTLRGCIRRAILTMLSLFYGYLVLIYTVFSMLRYRRKYFQIRRRESQPNCLRNSVHGVHSTIRVNDVNLHYVAKGDPKNDLLLLIHGFPDFWYTWRNQMTKFENFYTVALDLRGFNESDKLPYLKSYEFESILDDIKEFIRALGKKKAMLVGHDIGGCIVTLFAIKNPEMVDKLVLINSTHLHLYSHTLSSDLKQFFLSWQVFFFQLHLLPEFVILGKDFAFLENTFRSSDGVSLLDADDMEAYKYTFARPGAVTCALNYFRANIDCLNTIDSESKIIQPTLIIWGQNDPILCPKLGSKEILKKYFKSVEVESIPKVGHYAHIEQPHIVTECIRKFIS